MNVIAVIAQKGGSGKTTLAVSLAVAANQAGHSSVVIDLDSQATASMWSDRRRRPADGLPSVLDQPLVISAQPVRLANILKTTEAGGAQFVFIDTPPRAEQSAMLAARAATLVLIPCRAAIFDLDTVATTMQLLALAGSHIRSAAVLNGIPANGGERQQATDVLRQLGLMVCPVALGHRKAFAHSAALGQSAQEFDPHGKAADEIRGVYNYVTTLLKKG